MVPTAQLERIHPRESTRMTPRALGDGLFEVDATWGTVQPIRLAPGVRTIGELELVEHVQRGLPLIDTRLEHYHRDATTPSARGTPHEGMLDHLDELDPSVPTVFFCNGPQCAATPDTIRTLRLGHG
ncbi:MAG: rhodanese-like domain-containing protein [Actinomycetota bacterium]|nr:rhodanese-like domain-containing protein [Actinomycetota bacterium]